MLKNYWWCGGGGGGECHEPPLPFIQQNCADNENPTLATNIKTLLHYYSLIATVLPGKLSFSM